MEATTIAGMKVSRIGLGTWAIGGLEWGAIPDDVAVATCLGAVERLAALAKDRYGKTVLELAVRWVLYRPGVSVASWGAKRPEQLDAVAGVMGWKLDAAAMAEIDRIVAESVPSPVGPEYLSPKARKN
jgi:aryl-alcohol dehydrogenase-like predicted oxidoreductase